MTVESASLTTTWSANPESDVAGYKVYWDTTDALYDPAVFGQIAGIDVGPATSFTLACLPPGTYYLAATAYDADADGVDDWTDGHESWFSPEVEVTTVAIPACGPPAAPASLSATALSADYISLAWTDNAADETAYRVERSPDGSTGWSEIAVLSPNVTTYGDDGLACDTTYHYRVRAYRAGDGQYSAYSNVALGTTELCDLEPAVYLPMVIRP